MSVKILVGDVLARLADLPDSSVRCCVTSPPYYLLRDYGVAGQGGSEETPAHYLEWMVEVFAAVRRVLTEDGTLWLNLGDSYATNGSRQGNSRVAVRGSVGTVTGYRAVPNGFKAKDLMLMPARVAIALCDDGWYLRSDIIWHKPNPMPESVTDRPTKSHEHLFLLSKREVYFSDFDAIREELSDNTHARGGRDVPAGWNAAAFENGAAVHGERTERNNWKTPDGWDTSKGEGGHGSVHRQGSEKGKKRSGNSERKPASARGVPVDTNGSPSGSVAGSVPWEDSGIGRNSRDVWTIPIHAYKGAHFATFPPELPRRCILAGSARGDTVLDPFGGAGTTGLVANQLGREAVLIELNPTYAALAERRIVDEAPMLNTVVLA